MDEQTPNRLQDAEARSYEPPRYEVISLDCEITAYAPLDDEQPLF